MFYFGFIIIGGVFFWIFEWSEVEIYLLKNYDFFKKSKVLMILFLNLD